MKMRSFITVLTFALFAAVLPAAAQQDTVVVKGKKYIVHNVEKGETLYSLSRHYGVTIEELTETNKCLAHGLKSGQRLKVPVKEAQATQEQTPAVAPKSETTDANTGATTSQNDASNITDKTTTADQAQPKVETTEQVKVETTEQSVAQSTDAAAAPAADTTAVRPLFRKLQKGEVAEVALMLPMGTIEKPGKNFVDFYRGFLIGLDSVRMSGYSINLHLYNSGQTKEDVEAIVKSGALDKVNLVVGPVYETQMASVVEAMQGKGAVVVSPLARVENTKCDFLFQMSPSSRTRQLKIKELQDSTVRVVVISGEKVDKSFAKEVEEMLVGIPKVINHKFMFEHPSITQKLAAQRAKMGVAAPGDMKPYLTGTRPTVMIITAGNEFELGQILEAIKKARTSLVARRVPLAPHVIVGHPRWAKYPNIERETLFDNNIVQISSYDTRRNEPIVRRFDRRFIREFGVLPSRYAYRGYDAAMMFVKELYNSIESGMVDQEYRPLLTPYKFEIDSVSGVRVNTEWVKIVFNKNYTITHE